MEAIEETESNTSGCRSRCVTPYINAIAKSWTEIVQVSRYVSFISDWRECTHFFRKGSSSQPFRRSQRSLFSQRGYEGGLQLTFGTRGSGGPRRLSLHTPGPIPCSCKRKFGGHQGVIIPCVVRVFFAGEGKDRTAAKVAESYKSLRLPKGPRT